MSRGPVRALVIGIIVNALVLVGAAWVFAVQLGDYGDDLDLARAEVNGLRVELADTRARLTAAEADRDRLQSRVDALMQALRSAGVNPETVPERASGQASPSERATARPEPARRAGQRPSQPPPDRPASPPRSEPSAASPNPAPVPCPVPELPVVGCPAPR